MLPSIITKNHCPSFPIDPEHLPHRAVRLPVQLGLFWKTLRYARLTAINHPQVVYYDIWLEAMTGGRFRVRKASAGSWGGHPISANGVLTALLMGLSTLRPRSSKRPIWNVNLPENIESILKPASSCGYRL